jgi:hypothetical protein
VGLILSAAVALMLGLGSRLAAQTSTETMSGEMLAAHNQVRAAVSLPPLAERSALTSLWMAVSPFSSFAVWPALSLPDLTPLAIRSCWFSPPHRTATVRGGPATAGLLEQSPAARRTFFPDDCPVNEAEEKHDHGEAGEGALSERHRGEPSFVIRPEIDDHAARARNAGRGRETSAARGTCCTATGVMYPKAVSGQPCGFGPVYEKPTFRQVGGRW